MAGSSLTCLSGLSDRKTKGSEKSGHYQESMMGVMCWCLCRAVKDVLQLLEMPAKNLFEVCEEFSSLQGLERG